MLEIRRWGDDLRRQKSEKGEFPPSSFIRINGYRADFLNDKSREAPKIYFEKFNGIRQTYSVPEDKYLEEHDVS